MGREKEQEKAGQGGVYVNEVILPNTQCPEINEKWADAQAEGLRQVMEPMMGVGFQFLAPSSRDHPTFHDQARTAGREIQNLAELVGARGSTGESRQEDLIRMTAAASLMLGYLKQQAVTRHGGQLIEDDEDRAIKLLDEKIKAVEDGDEERLIELLDEEEKETDRAELRKALIADMYVLNPRLGAKHALNELLGMGVGRVSPDGVLQGGYDVVLK